MFSVLITVCILSCGSGGEAAELPEGCSWADNSCHPDAQDTILTNTETETGKALCCTKGLYKDEEGEAAERSGTQDGCRWVGTAPICSDPKCHANEYSFEHSNSGNGHSCWTGHKTLCCLRNGQAFIESPEFTNGVKAISNFLEKNTLSECDTKYMNEIKESLENMIKDKDAISKEGLELSSVAAGLFHTASLIMESYKDKIPDLAVYKQAIDDTVALAKKAYSSWKAILAAAEFPVAAIKAAWGGAKMAQEAIKIIRNVFPSLGTDACTDKIESMVFKDIGGGTLGGAGIGGTIGGTIGSIVPVFGTAAGAAIGGALGGLAGSVGGLLKWALHDDKATQEFCSSLNKPPANNKCKSIFAEKK